MALRRLCAAGLLSAVRGAAVEAQALARYRDLWESHKETFGKYGIGNEYERFLTFAANAAFVEEENAKHNSYTLGLGPLADLSLEEFRRTRLGTTSRPAELWGAAPRLGVFHSAGEALSASVDWREQGAVTPVKDQGSCGACWTFSTTGALEGAWQIATSDLVSLSEQQFLDCSLNNLACEGGNMALAFAFAETAQVCTEVSYPYIAKQSGSCLTDSQCTVGIPHSGVTGYSLVEQSETALMAALSVGPVSVSVMAADAAFQHYSAGVFNGCSGAATDHGVILVGYGTDAESGLGYWWMKNSWGASWGEDGYMKLARGVGGDGECGVLTDSSFPTVDGSVSPNVTTPPPGEWVDPLVETNWVKYLSFLAIGVSEFPAAGASTPEMKQFVLNCAAVPLVIVALGVSATISAFARMICCRPKTRRDSPQPSVKPSVGFTLLAFVLVVVGACLFAGPGLGSLDTARNQLDNIFADFDEANVLGQNLSSTAQALQQNINDVYPFCPNITWPYVNESLAPLQAAVGIFAEQMDQFNEQVLMVPEKFAVVRNNYDDFIPLFEVFLGVPTALVTVACALMLTSVLTSRLFCGPTMTRFTDCFVLRIGGVFLIVTIFLVTLASSAQLLVGIGTAVFCKDADANVISHVNYNFLGQFEAQLTTYYVGGRGGNPLEMQLAFASDELDSVMVNISDYTDSIKLVCPGWTSTNITSNLNATQGVIAQAQTFISADNIYPYYDKMVHHDICDTCLQGLSWLAIFQTVAGLCVLPCVAEATASFLGRWAAWQDWRRESAAAALAADRAAGRADVALLG